MCTKDPSSQKYTALEYINIFGVIPENANEDHRKSHVSRVTAVKVTEL